MQKASVHHLRDLPNISFRLAEELIRVGIRDVEALRQAGAERAWGEIFAAGFQPDYFCLLALEGAIGGVPWREVSGERRRELRRFADGAAVGSATFSMAEFLARGLGTLPSAASIS